MRLYVNRLAGVKIKRRHERADQATATLAGSGMAKSSGNPSQLPQGTRSAFHDPLAAGIKKKKAQTLKSCAMKFTKRPRLMAKA
jgi:hypothetical protein